jgi:DNA-binding CsgD family transcriptional regulator
VATVSTPLLERDLELATLRSLLEAARTGDGRLASVEGTAGIGKSRLLAEARAMAKTDGMRVLAARGGEFEAEFAFGLVRQLFEPLLAGLTGDARSHLLAGAASLVEPLLAPGATGTAAVGAADSSFAIQHGLYWLTANIAFDQPTLIAVDDLHWADRPSLRWLDYLVRRLDGVPLLVLVATRSPEQSHDPMPLGELLDDPAVAVIHPGPLSIISISELARERVGLDPDEAFCSALSEATGGNPLFVAALLDTLAREGVAPTAEEAARVLELGPRAISRAVSLRLARLPAVAVQVAQAAAIMGEGTELRYVAALSGLDFVDAARAAGRLVEVDLLRRVDPIEFFHPVIRAAIHQAIDPGTRLETHRRAAEILADGGAPPEQSAAHLLQVAPAADPLVVRALRNAADRALASGAHDLAVAYLRRALAEPPERGELFETLLDLGRSERRTGASEAVARLESALTEASDPVRRARAALEYGRTLFHANRPADGLQAMLDAGEALGDSEPDLRERLEAEVIGSARWLAEYYPLAAERLGRIQEERLHGGVGTAQLLAALAIDETARCGSRGRAVARARRALAMQISQEEGAIGFYHATAALIQAGETEEALRAYEHAAKHARAGGDLFALARSLGFLAITRLRHGDLLGSESDLREGLELIRPAAGASGASQWILGTLADVLIERGEFEQAQALVESAGLEQQRPDNTQLFFLHAAYGKLCLARREPEQALSQFQLILTVGEPGGGTNPNWIPARSLAALALHQLGQDRDATALAKTELDLTRHWGAPVGIAVSLRTLGLVEGGAASLRHLEEATILLSATPARLEHARALVEYGAALRRANRRSEARDKLRHGLELAHHLAALPLVEQASEELAATGARPRKLLQTGLETLTASERRIAQMAATDMSNKEIAQALFVTVKTVEVHLTSVYRKLQVSSRRQLSTALNAPSTVSAR